MKLKKVWFLSMISMLTFTTTFAFSACSVNQPDVTDKSLISFNNLINTLEGTEGTNLKNEIETNSKKSLSEVKSAYLKADTDNKKDAFFSAYSLWILKNLDKVKLREVTLNSQNEDVVSEVITAIDLKNSKIIDTNTVSSHEGTNWNPKNEFNNRYNFLAPLKNHDEEENEHEDEEDLNVGLKPIANFMAFDNGYFIRLDRTVNKEKLQKVSINRYLLKFNKNFPIQELTNIIHQRTENEDGKNVAFDAFNKKHGKPKVFEITFE